MSESLRVFNTRQESGNGARAENWVSICASIWDQNPETGSRSFPAIAIREMGGVWLGRVLINAQIAAGLRVCIFDLTNDLNPCL